jgi:hypothetical protein
MARFPKATECKDCGSPELHVGARCKLCTSIYMKKYNRIRREPLKVAKKEPLNRTTDEQKKYLREYYQRNKDILYEKERVRKKNKVYVNKPNIVNVDKMMDISNLKEFQRPDGSIYKSVTPIFSNHILINK